MKLVWSDNKNLRRDLLLEAKIVHIESSDWAKMAEILAHGSYESCCESLWNTSVTVRALGVFLIHPFIYLSRYTYVIRLTED